MEIIIIILLLLILVNLKISKMAKISTYPNDAQANYNDKVIGTDATTNATFNYTLRQIKNYKIPKISELPEYQNYLDNDNVINFSKIKEPGVYVIDNNYREKDGGATNLNPGQGIILYVEFFENIADPTDNWIKQTYDTLDSQITKKRICKESTISTTDFS